MTDKPFRNIRGCHRIRWMTQSSGVAGWTHQPWTDSTWGSRCESMLAHVGDVEPLSNGGRQIQRRHADILTTLKPVTAARLQLWNTRCCLLVAAVCTQAGVKAPSNTTLSCAQYWKNFIYFIIYLLSSLMVNGCINCSDFAMCLNASFAVPDCLILLGASHGNRWYPAYTSAVIGHCCQHLRGFQTFLMVIIIFSIGVFFRVNSICSFWRLQAGI